MAWVRLQKKLQIPSSKLQRNSKDQNPKGFSMSMFPLGVLRQSEYHYLESTPTNLYGSVVVNTGGVIIIGETYE